MRLIRLILLLLIDLVLLLIAVDALWLLHGMAASNPAAPQHEVAAALFSSMPALLRPDTLLKEKLWWCAAIALVLLSWAASLTAIRLRPRPLRVKTPDGDSILLDPGAIINFAKSQIDAHPAVTRHKVKVRQIGGKSVAVTAIVKVAPISSLPQIKRELEGTLRDSFSDVLGIAKIDDIAIVLDLDEKSLGRRPGPKTKADEPPPLPARAEIAADDEPREVTYGGEKKEE